MTTSSVEATSVREEATGSTKNSRHADLLNGRIHREPSDAFLPSGKIRLGANYWASHAGPFMWRNWRPEIIESDFKLLAGHGLKTLRIFPLWPDFQPIDVLRGANGKLVEFRHDEIPLPDSDEGRCGVSSKMLDRLVWMVSVAERHDIDLIVGLVTGWMSGRLFIPSGLQHLNPITDPGSIMWQCRLVSAIVRRSRHSAAIKAWDLGNECNVMGQASREQAWLWTCALANTIRSADQTRPIISGMHSLSADPAEPWSISDQGELTDVLTTHPYPIFTPHCNREPIDTMRPLLHAAAETCVYSDLSGRPAMVEEFGTLGPMLGNDATAGNFARISVANIWAHDGRGALWWCAHDQTALEGAPHDWIALERELGLLRHDTVPKPALLAMGEMRELIDRLPVSVLPRRRIDAVCILTQGQDNWGAAFSTFILAKQAGFDVRFHYSSQSLPDASLYLLPSLQGLSSLSRRSEMELLKRVESGAELYLSMDDGHLGNFSRFTGLEVISRWGRDVPCRFEFEGNTFTLPSSVRFKFRVKNAEVLARDETDSPVFSKVSLGNGAVHFLSLPMETALAARTEAFVEDAPPFWKLFRQFAKGSMSHRTTRKTSAWIGITEHPLSDGGVVVLLINFLNRVVEDSISFGKGFRLEQVWEGPKPCELSLDRYAVQLPAYGIGIWKLEPKFGVTLLH